MELADLAFAARRSAYTSWKLEEHVRVCTVAQKAMKSESGAADFDGYWQALVAWQAFRRATEVMKRSSARRMLRTVGNASRGVRLSTLDRARDLPCLTRIVALARMLKLNSNKAGSLVAMSKALHFINPRLFVILDRGVMVDYVLAHGWLRAALPADFKLDVDHYPAFLLWCAELLQRSPDVMPAFVDAFQAQAAAEGVSVPADVGTWESLAVEWLLQGLVEIPPDGLRGEAAQR